jgi:hypothetical protein
MSFTLYDACAPVFIYSLQNMSAWLDKAVGGKAESERRVQPVIATPSNPQG